MLGQEITDYVRLFSLGQGSSDYARVAKLVQVWPG